MVKKLLLVTLVFSFSINGFGQITQPGLPFSNEHELRKEVPFSLFSTRESVKMPGDKANAQPMVAGYTLPFYYKTKPDWEEVSSGKFVARLGVIVPDATAINIYFSDFNLSGNQQLFVYNPGKKQILGALTEANNGDFLATAFISGDSLIIEFNSSSKTASFPFQINEIGVSTTNFNQSDRGFGDAESCEILVNCPEGDNWQREKNGIARVLVKEGDVLYWCSGSLVNNTKQDGTPYFLTANHCGPNASTVDYKQWVFYFQYESPDCELPQSEPPLMSMTGATKLASAPEEIDKGSDFKLLLLDDAVPVDYKPYYNGWSRIESPANSGVAIHHPEGDIKMISTFSDPAVSTSYLGVASNPNGYYWKIEWAPTDGGYGVTEGGSSGSPLFNSKGQMVGALTGGYASCSEQEKPDYFGKFAYSWNSNGSDAASQLSVWLAPDNPEIISLNGTDLDTVTISAEFRAENTNILLGGTIDFVNNSFGNILQYEWTFQGGDPEFSEAETPVPIQYNTSGIYTVRLVVKSLNQQDSLVRYNYIHVMPLVSPSLGTGLFSLNFGKKLPDDLQIEVYDVIGQKVQFSIASQGTSNVVVDISTLSDNMYIIKTKSQSGEHSNKVVLSR